MRFGLKMFFGKKSIVVRRISPRFVREEAELDIRESYDRITISFRRPRFFYEYNGTKGIFKISRISPETKRTLGIALAYINKFDVYEREKSGKEKLICPLSEIYPDPR
ncbi:MAG: hypothetical protein PHP35_01075 [Candidatus Colwellbacteria bacterium]|nr:hypothetical protein [Candidatus Colwellbacteria bacterium]